MRTDGLLLLRDLGSTNGTRVNGTRVRRAALLPNDQLTIAHFKYRVFLGPDEPLPPVAPNDHTQALDRHDLMALLEKKKRGTEPSDPDEPGRPEPLQRNQLPDAYPD